MVLSYSRDRKILRGLQYPAARVGVLSGVDSDATLHRFQLIWRSVDAHVVDPFPPQRIDVGIQLRKLLESTGLLSQGSFVVAIGIWRFVVWDAVNVEGRVLSHSTRFS